MTSTDTFAEEPDLASLGALLTDRTSAAMCLALLDGRAWTAADLDRPAGVAPFTANSHRDRLVACWANTARAGKAGRQRISGVSKTAYAPATPCFLE
ncbi:hypothetical protein [Streptomyces litchfieldiae]|uniref:hypothetical protein n=1 Tax=Streptomyces litchfieldiae TaxID=3075543 RepID=UPI00374E1180